MSFSPQRPPRPDPDAPGIEHGIASSPPAVDEATLSSPPVPPDDQPTSVLPAGTDRTQVLPATTEAQPRQPAPKGRHKGKGRLSFLHEVPVLVAVAFLLALLIKTFLLQAFFIPSESMEPTLAVGDRVLVNKVVYKLHPPRRGDIIVFEDPNPVPEPDRNPLSALWQWLTEGLGVSPASEKDFIKRVIGLPGDTVEVDGRGRVYVNGRRLREPYLADPVTGRYGPVPVPPRTLFVMGDNRGNSNDSRGQLGFIPLDRVVGRAFVVVWPPSRFALLGGG